MIKVKAKANFGKAVAKLRNMKRQIRRTAGEVLESEGRIVAIALAKSTQPFGTGSEAKDMGERAVARDIAKVYASLGDVFSKLPTLGLGDAAQFWKLIKTGKTEAAMDLIRQSGARFAGIRIGPFDGGALHRQARNSHTGRVNQTAPSLIVSDSGPLKSYVQSKINFVGYAKSAWAAVARQLGGTRGLRGPRLSGGERDITANWITRKRGEGTVHREYDTPRARLTLRSSVRYARNVLSDSAFRNAIRIARQRIIKQIEMAAKYELKHPRAL
jgi:hypothetical protein